MILEIQVITKYKLIFIYSNKNIKNSDNIH